MVVWWFIPCRFNSLVQIVSVINWMTEPVCLLLGCTATFELTWTKVCTVSTWFVFFFLCYRSYIILYVVFRGVGGVFLAQKPLGKMYDFIRNVLYTRICFQHKLGSWLMGVFLYYIMGYQHPSTVQMPRRYYPTVLRKENPGQMEKTWAQTTGCYFNFMEVLRKHNKIGKKRR